MAGGGEHALSSNAPRPRQFDYLGTNHESFFRESQLKAQRSKEQQSIKDIKEDTKSSPVFGSVRIEKQLMTSVNSYFQFHCSIPLVISDKFAIY
eukprot:13317000-Ditylum_brightwellii.AAC.1